MARFKHRTLHVPNLMQISKTVAYAHLFWVRHLLSSTFDLGLRELT